MDKNLIVHNRNILILMVVSFSLLTALTFFFGLFSAKEESDVFKRFITNEMKTIVQSEVLNRYDQISYDMEKLESEGRQLIKEKNDLFTVVFEKMNVKSQSLSETRQDLLKAIDTVAECDLNVIYFVLDGNGTFLRSGIQKKLNNIDLTQLAEIMGEETLSEIMKAKESDDGMFCNFEWPEEFYGTVKKQVLFCKYLPNYDLIVVTGVNNDVVDEKLKQETFNRIQNFYEDEDLYMFIVDFEGNIHVHPDKDLIGKNFHTLDSDEGRLGHEALVKVASEENEGFGFYEYNQRNSDVVSQKISYVKKIESWDVYIGMGFYIDNINAEVNRQMATFLERQFMESALIVLVFVVTTIILIVLIRKGLHLQKEQIKEEEKIFTELFQTSNQGLVIVNLKGEVMYSNKKALKILDAEMEKRMAQQFDSTGHIKGRAISDDVIACNSNGETEKILNYHWRDFNYLGQDVYIYYLSDITEEYVNMNDLKEQALNDILTGLPNRRKLLDDFKHWHDMNTSGFLAMVDIDYFKKVNDVFGHESGDEILKVLAQTFRTNLRSTDNLYRYGGEEFVLYLNEVNEKEAVDIIERIKQEFGKESEKVAGYPVTFSVGLVNMGNTSKKHSLTEVINRCDQLLYKAKNNGRNRIETE